MSFVYKGVILEERRGEWGTVDAIDEYERELRKTIRENIDYNRIVQMVVETLTPKIHDLIKEELESVNRDPRR